MTHFIQNAVDSASAGRKAIMGHMYGMNSIIQDIRASEKNSSIFIQNTRIMSSHKRVAKNMLIPNMTCQRNQPERVDTIVASLDKMYFEAFSGNAL